jgi:hypothetical protein
MKLWAGTFAPPHLDICTYLDSWMQSAAEAPNVPRHPPLSSIPPSSLQFEVLVFVVFVNRTGPSGRKGALPGNCAQERIVTCGRHEEQHRER